MGKKDVLLMNNSFSRRDDAYKTLYIIVFGVNKVVIQATSDMLECQGESVINNMANG
jgi:hypothetical protein